VWTKHKNTKTQKHKSTPCHQCGIQHRNGIFVGYHFSHVCLVTFFIHNTSKQFIFYFYQFMHSTTVFTAFLLVLSFAFTLKIMA